MTKARFNKEVKCINIHHPHVGLIVVVRRKYIHEKLKKV